MLSASKLIKNGYCYLRSVLSVKICCSVLSSMRVANMKIRVVVYVTLLTKVKFVIYFVSMFGDSSRSFNYIAMVFVSHPRWINWESFKLIEGRFLSYAIRFIYPLFFANLEAIFYLKLICFWLVLSVVPMRLSRCCFPQLPQGSSWKYLN